MKKPTAEGEEGAEEGTAGGEEQTDLMLDSIGCTANVIVID